MTVTVGKGRATHEASAVVSHRTVCGKVWTDVAEIGATVTCKECRAINARRHNRGQP